MYKKLNLKHLKTGNTLSVYKVNQNLNDLTKCIWLHEDSKEPFNVSQHVSAELAKARVGNVITDENNQDLYLVINCSQT